MAAYEMDPLTGFQERTLEMITDPASYGGAVAHRANPCIVIYGVPVWVMPNGTCRVGEPDANALTPYRAIAEITRLRDIAREEVS